MNQLLEDMFQLEREYKFRIINSQNTDDLENKYSYLTTKVFMVNKNPLDGGLVYDLNLFKDVEISEDIFCASSRNVDTGKLESYDRTIVDSFFKNRFGIDVSNTEIITSKDMPMHAEAYAVACGTNEHFIVVGNNPETSYVSYDLLIHEFGHTVEFTEGRKNKKLEEHLKHPVLSEAVAHYYQLVYMMENSTKDEKLSMIASFTQAYLFYRCMLIMINTDPNAKSFDPDIIVSHPDFHVFRRAFIGTHVLTNFFDRWRGQSFIEAYKQHHAQRFGVFLAFNFIKHKLDITELFRIKYPMGKVRLEDLIEQTSIDPDVLFDFTNMDRTLIDFVNGSL